MVILLRCLCVCAVMAGHGTEVTIRKNRKNDIDMRSFDMSRWPVVMCVLLRFSFMATEFAHQVRRGRDLLGSMVGSVGDMASIRG